MSNHDLNAQESFQVERVQQSGSLAKNVAGQLEKMITQGKIEVGQKLPTENNLCDMFGVSRTVIREAITQLKSLNLVETKRGVGTTVLRSTPADTFYARAINPTAVEDILHVLELRLAVETAAAELAAERRTEQDLRQIEQHLLAFQQARREHGQAREEDFAFHLSIAIASKNPLIRNIYEQYNNNIIPRSKILKENIDQDAAEKYLLRVEQEHVDIFEAIKAGDAAAAKAAMHQHLFRSYQMYKQYKAG